MHNFFATFIEVLRDRPPGHDWELEPGVTCGDYLFGMLQVLTIQNSLHIVPGTAPTSACMLILRIWNKCREHDLLSMLTNESPSL